VLSGAVAVVEDLGRAGQRVISVHGERRFLGELDLFSTAPVSLTALVVRAGEVVGVPDDRMREVFRPTRELKELVLRAFLLRRSMLLELAADLRIVGRADSLDKPPAAGLRPPAPLDAVFVDLDSTATGPRCSPSWACPRDDLPVVVWRHGGMLRNPTDDEVLAVVESGGMTARPGARARPTGRGGPGGGRRGQSVAGGSSRGMNTSSMGRGPTYCGRCTAPTGGPTSGPACRRCRAAARRSRCWSRCRAGSAVWPHPHSGAGGAGGGVGRRRLSRPPRNPAASSAAPTSRLTGSTDVLLPIAAP
jgi:hypothetical protein